MLRFLRKYPIRVQLLLLALSTGIVMFTIICLIYFQVSKVLTNYNTEYTNNMTYQIKKTISNNCDLMDRLVTSIAFNRAVQQYASETNVAKKYAMFVDINSFFINIASMNQGIIDIAIINNNGDRVYYLAGENNGVKDILEKLPKKVYKYYTGIEYITYTNINKKCFIIACDINSILNDHATGERLGTAAIVLDAEVLSLDVNKDLKESATKFYLLDRNNQIFSMSQSSISEKTIDDVCKQFADAKPGKYIITISGTRYVVNKDDLPEIGGKIISVVPEDKLFYDIDWTRKLIISLFVLALALLSIPFMVITNNIVSPLRKFINFFSLVKEEELVGLKQRLHVDGYHEMVIMVGEFNSLLDEIDSLTKMLVLTNSRLYEAELEKKKSELSYLKSQINPHFLYNTLEVMKGSAIDEGAVKTSGMAKALAQIFRYSVKGAEIVTLLDEVEIVKYYLYIQQVRFSGRIKVYYNFSQESLQCRIPQMILQPIVENAVFHGLETKLGQGGLWFESKIDESEILYISIKDDGVGMDEEALSAIQAKLMNGVNVNSVQGVNESIGLKNVDNRIKLTYGDEYGITISSTLGQGTEIIIRIPARRS